MALLAGCAAHIFFRGEVASVSLQTEPNRNTFAIFLRSLLLVLLLLLYSDRGSFRTNGAQLKKRAELEKSYSMSIAKRRTNLANICIFSVLHMRLRIRKLPKICYHIRLLNGFVEKCMHFLVVKCICMPKKLSSSVHICKCAESAVVLQRLSRSIREQSLCLQLHGCSVGYFWTTDGSR